MDASSSAAKAGWLHPALWRAGWVYWLAQVSGWGLLWLTNLVAAASVHGQWLLPWAAVELSVDLGMSMLATHVLRAVIVRQRWLDLSLPGLVRRAAVAVLILSFLMTCFFKAVAMVMPGDAVLVEHRQGVHSWEPGLWAVQFSQMGITTGIWCALYLGYHLRRRQRRRELEFWQLRAALADAELHALRAQVNPHFLFNCLNSLRTLVAEDPGRAESSITHLANLLRYTLQSGAQTTVALSEEWGMVQDYVALETLRFEDALRVEADLDPATLSCQVPPLGVQTLVENAVKYGVANSRATTGTPEPITVRTWIEPADGVLRVEVTNAGKLSMSSVRGTDRAPGKPTTGLGLQNVRERLRRLFGEEAALDLREEPPGRVVATLRLPFRALPLPKTRGRSENPSADVFPGTVRDGCSPATLTVSANDEFAGTTHR